MDNHSEKEVFTQEQLIELNERLKNTENIELPENLKAENIAIILNDEIMWKPEEKKTISKKSRKRKIYSLVAVAASFAIVFTSLMIAKPWEKADAPPLNNAQPPIVNSVPQDYSIIEAKFADYAEKYEKYQQNYRLYGVVDDFLNFGTKNEAVMDMAVGSSSNTSAKPSTTSPSAESITQSYGNKDHGETNEQVQGVSEADIIKNDGKYLYAVNPNNADWGTYYDALYDSYGIVKTTDENGEPVEEESIPESSDPPVLKYDCKISVIEPKADGKLQKIGEININQEDEKDIYHMVVNEIYVKDNRLIALVECFVRQESEATDNFKYRTSDVYVGATKTITMAVCFDISDRTTAKEMWRAYQDGNYISSRLIDNQLVFLSNYYVDISDDEETVINNCVPKISVSNAPMERVPCDCVVIGSQVDSPDYLVASTVDIEDKATFKTQAILGAGSNVYCTTETLYATTTVYQDREAGAEIFGTLDENTSIYKFDIRNGDIKYIGCGSVKGSALNQFSIDEYNGYLRIATTSGNWGDSLSNQVYVLNNELNVVGEITGIAKGETIKSVRFTGDTGYVVTFEQTDPLFVIDLSDPEKPEIKGELKIPGFSAYLHPVGENLLLGVGVDGTNDGQGNGMKVSLFDVSDPENPIEADKIEFSGIDTANRWTYIYSEAFYSHKAMCWDSDDAVMYIPYGKQDRIWASSSGESLSKTNTAGIIAVKVDTEAKKLSTDGNYMCSSTDIESSPDFSRVTYIGDVIIGFNQYTNGGHICSFNKDTQMQTDDFYLSK